LLLIDAENINSWNAVVQLVKLISPGTETHG